IQRDPVDRAFLETCCSTLKHRGPDHTGIHIAGNVGIGMTRLAIIDLSSGNQPMFSPDGSIAVVFNGEIYNFPELKKILSSKHVFKTTSDTEVILNGYIEWGADVFEKLNGIFAVALWDAGKRQLILARDPMGVKPLYYSAERDRFMFSSELKTFTSTGIASTVSMTAVRQFLSSGYVFHPFSSIEGVCQLPQGELLIVDNDLHVAKKKFRTLPPAGFEKGLSEDDWARRLADELKRAVIRQTISDVPVGLLLSSGLDSMFILSALKESGSFSNLKTYTVYYDNPTFNEHKDVKRITSDWGIANEQALLDGKGVSAELENMCYHLDNLDFLPTSIAIYFASKLAGSRGKVVLAGNGGDELFFGYPTHKATSLLLKMGPAAAALSMLRPLTRFLPGGDDYLTLREKATRFTSACGRKPELAHLLWRNIFDFSEMNSLMGVSNSDISSLDQIMAPQLDAFKEADELGYTRMDRFMAADLKTWMTDCSLSMWDKAGMAASLEIRVPIIDLDFVGSCLSIPPEIRAADPGSKRLFRKMCSLALPPEIVNLPKHGFQAPVAEWMRGPLKNSFMEYTRALPNDIFSKEYREKLWRDFEAGHRDNSLKLWCLGCLSVWAGKHNIKWTSTTAENSF
ncbi:MAG TPA: asparagine synthase (glutamine-hydrolyzing), partial [bacterium]|nr:asparagine synthase (glutamine-hydrolyzing) [bacterium]